MLFNPDWKKKPQSKDWKSLDNLIAWLETKPADETYDYYKSTNCLLAQYLKAQGKKNVWVNAHYAEYGETKWKSWFDPIHEHLPPFFNEIAALEKTFGGALARALKASGTSSPRQEVRDHNLEPSFAH